MSRPAVSNSLRRLRPLRILRSPKFWVGSIGVGAVVVVLCVLARNPLARRAGMLVGSYVLNTRVEIGNLDIQWTQILVNDVTVFEPVLRDQVQVSVSRIAIVPSLSRGFSDGVWLERVAVDKPALHVRFDSEGNLLSVFPKGSGEESSGGIGTIPVQHLTIHDAGLIVYQEGRSDLRIENVAVVAAFSEEISVRAKVPSILAGKIDFQCRLDAKSFGGTTRLHVTGIELDTGELANLPLVPKSLAEEPISASFAMSIQGTHPPDDIDLRHHTLACAISTRGVQSKRFGMLCPKIDVKTEQSDGIVQAKVRADPLSGDFRLDASVDWTQPKITAEVKTFLRNCQLQLAAQHVPELEKLNAVATSEGTLRASWISGKLEFHGDVKSGLHDIEFDAIELPAVTTQVVTQGAFTPNDTSPLQGFIEGSFTTSKFELCHLAKRFELPELLGSVLASGKIRVPLERMTDPTSYLAEANVALQDIAGAEMIVPDSEISASLRDGIATVDAPRVNLCDIDGDSIVDFTARSVASLHDDGEFTATAEMFVEPSAASITTLGLNHVEPRGRVSCRVDARCMMSELVSVRSWRVKASADSQDVAVAGETVDDVQLRAELHEGVLAAEPLILRWRDNTCTIHTEGELGETIAVRGNFQASDLKLRDVSEVLSRFSKSALPAVGLADIEGKWSYQHDLNVGTTTAQASGVANLEQAAFSRTKIGTAALRWQADLDGLKISTSSDDFFGGRFDVNAHVAELDWTKTKIEGTFAEVQVPRLVSLSRQRLPSTGVFDGGFRVSSIASLNELTGDVWMRSRQMTVHKIPVELAQTHVTVQNGVIGAGADGLLADARWSGSAESSVVELMTFFEQSNFSLAAIPLTAQFRLESMSIAPIATALKLPPELRFLGGNVSAEIVRDAAARDGRHLATVTTSLDDLRWKHAQLSDRITAELVVHPKHAELTSVQGRFADGKLSGKALVQFENTPTGRFDFVASRVNLRRATSPFGIADVAGSGTVKVRGRLGHEITGHADLTVENAVAAGVDVRQVRLPVDWSVTPTAKTVRWQCRAGTVSVGGGNVRIATQGNYANTLNMNSSVRVERVDLSKVMQNGSAGSGIVDGEVIVRAKQAKSPKQFVGTFDFEMKNIQALKIPVLDQLPQMVNLSPSIPGRGQDGGTIHGRIGGGLVYVDEIAVYQSNVQVLVYGKATMQGQLDLDVIVSTESTSPTDQLVSMLDSPLMLAAPAPVALIAKANDLIKDRIVRVHVGGTANSPTLRLQPGKQLTQEAVRFFLTSSFGSAGTRVSNLPSQTRIR